MAAATPTERSQRRSLLSDMLPAAVGYAVVLAVALSLVGDTVDTAGEWTLLYLPIVPAMWGLRAGVRHVRRVDEYRQLLILESMAIGFAGTMITALTFGFLAIGGATTPWAGWAVCGTGAAAWMLALATRSRR